MRSITTFGWANSFLRQTLALTVANLKSRYRKTVAGFIWVLLNPIIIYGTQCFVFRRVIRIPVQNYAIFLLSGLLPWIFIAQTLEMCTPVFVSSSRILKSYSVHPLVYLFAQIADNSINFVAGFLVVLLPSFFLFPNKLAVLLLPIPLLLIFFGTFGIAWLLALTNVFLRDTKFILTFSLNVLFFLTPVLYPPEYVPEGLRWLTWVNPFYRLICPFRTVIYEFEWTRFLTDCLVAAGVSVTAIVLASWLWRKKRNDFYFYL